jgi:Zn finger protein HypA/HybF involved in hydrogenase expression
MARRFLCKKCRYVFDREIAGDASVKVEVRCPVCESTDVMETPTWAPLDSGWNIFETNEWEYECQDCKRTFKLPVPKSPAEDESRRCPFCDSKHLHLLTGGKALPLHCG